MSDAKLKIRREFDRPDPATLTAFEGVLTGPVVDAMGRRGALNEAIRPLTNATRFVDSALSVWTVSRDNRAPYAALKSAKPGDVLMIATGGADEVSVLGDIAIGMAKNSSIVAVVTDGLVRDLDGLNEIGIPVFARGLSPNSPFKNGPGEIGTPISLGRRNIDAGDIVMGDCDGVVVVPKGEAAETIKRLSAIKKKEAGMEAKVRNGIKQPDWLDDVLADSDIAFLD
jgi:4-hydroxy-4-methyl-2-oxoglutarate aldolase